jgi:hypothetical protein
MYPDVRGSPTGWSTQTGLTPVFGSCSRVAFSTGVQAFSEAHSGRGTIRTMTAGHRESNAASEHSATHSCTHIDWFVYSLQPGSRSRHRSTHCCCFPDMRGGRDYSTNDVNNVAELDGVEYCCIAQKQRLVRT